MEETQAEISFLDFDERFKKSLEKKRWGILCAIFFYTFIYMSYKN